MKSAEEICDKITTLNESNFSVINRISAVATYSNRRSQRREAWSQICVMHKKKIALFLTMFQHDGTLLTVCCLPPSNIEHNMTYIQQKQQI